VERQTINYDDLNPTSNPLFVFAQLQTIEHLPESDNWIFQAQLCAHLRWINDVVFSEKKVR